MQSETTENIKREMKRYLVGILAVTEMQWKKNDGIRSNGYKLIYSGREQSEMDGRLAKAGR